MSLEDKKDGDDGQSGQGGRIEFKAFIATGERLRDDLLSGDEKRRLLSAHASMNEAGVKKQSEIREQRKQLKAGQLSLVTYRQGMGAGAVSQYKPHRILADKAQFSGIDREVNALPTENIAETNQEKREELQYQYNLTHKHENIPRFNPKPLHR